MLRPSNSLLGSSRAARRRNVRAERRKALGSAARGGFSLASGAWRAALNLLLLFGLPLLYLSASYLFLDLPLRWLFHKEPFTGVGAGLFVGSILVGLFGIARALQGAEPVAPVRPRFARIMLGCCWFAALVMTIGDLAS